jgi:hypothetical protein
MEGMKGAEERRRSRGKARPIRVVEELRRDVPRSMEHADKLDSILQWTIKNNVA